MQNMPSSQSKTSTPVNSNPSSPIKSDQISDTFLTTTDFPSYKTNPNANATVFRNNIFPSDFSYSTIQTSSSNTLNVSAQINDNTNTSTVNDDHVNCSKSSDKFYINNGNYYNNPNKIDDNQNKSTKRKSSDSIIQTPSHDEIHTAITNLKLLIHQRQIKNNFIQKIQHLLSNSKHISSSTKKSFTPIKNINLRTDHEFLTRFLLVAKLDPDKALKRYVEYYETTIQIPKIIDILIHDFSWFLTASAYIESKEPPFLLYGYDHKNRRILGYQSELFDPDTPNFVEYSLSALMTLIDFSLENDIRTQKNGCVFVGKYSRFGYKKFKILANPIFFKILSKMVGNSLPVLTKRVLISDGPSLLNALYKMLRPFLTEKINDRVTMTGSDHEIVIEELGGVEFTPDFIPGGERGAERMLTIEEGLQYVKKAFPVVLEGEEEH